MIGKATFGFESGVSMKIIMIIIVFKNNLTECLNNKPFCMLQEF